MDLICLNGCSGLARDFVKPVLRGFDAGLEQYYSAVAELELDELTGTRPHVDDPARKPELRVLGVNKVAGWLQATEQGTRINASLLPSCRLPGNVFTLWRAEA